MLHTATSCLQAQGAVEPQHCRPQEVRCLVVQAAESLLCSCALRTAGHNLMHQAILQARALPGADQLQGGQLPGHLQRCRLGGGTLPGPCAAAAARCFARPDLPADPSSAAVRPLRTCSCRWTRWRWTASRQASPLAHSAASRHGRLPRMASSARQPRRLRCRTCRCQDPHAQTARRGGLQMHARHHWQQTAPHSSSVSRRLSSRSGASARHSCSWASMSGACRTQSCRRAPSPSPAAACWVSAVGQVTHHTGPPRCAAQLCALTCPSTRCRRTRPRAWPSCTPGRRPHLRRACTAAWSTSRPPAGASPWWPRSSCSGAWPRRPSPSGLSMAGTGPQSW